MYMLCNSFLFDCLAMLQTKGVAPMKAVGCNRSRVKSCMLSSNNCCCNVPLRGVQESNSCINTTAMVRK